MNNDLANFSVLTGLLVETATAVKLRLCEPIRQPPKGILYYKSSQGSRDLTCWIHMWPDLPKGVLYTHSFRSHFSLSFDRYNNRPTVHACTTAKSSAVCFYWGLIHGPVWRPRMLGWSVNGLSFPGQADRRQGIATGLAGETGHRFSYILSRVELKTAWIEAIRP